MAVATEVRIFAEGSLRWIRYSAGALGTWTTASGANGVSSSGAVAFVQAGTTMSSAQTINTIPDRGIPNHHKRADRQPITLSITYLEGITANNPAIHVSAIPGASVPLLNFEVKSTQPELGAGTAEYYQFHGCALTEDSWTDAEDGNKKQQSFVALSMVGPTASGYLG